MAVKLLCLLAVHFAPRTATNAELLGLVTAVEAAVEVVAEVVAEVAVEVAVGVAIETALK